MGIKVTVALAACCAHLQLLKARRQAVDGRDGALAGLRGRASDGGVQRPPHLRPDGPAGEAWAAIGAAAAAAVAAAPDGVCDGGVGRGEVLDKLLAISRKRLQRDASAAEEGGVVVGDAGGERGMGRELCGACGEEGGGDRWEQGAAVLGGRARRDQLGERASV
jgi:hypothetical protein